MTTLLCVPQWQGSAAAGALRLVTGAHRSAALVPADTTVLAPINDTSGDIVDGVRALTILAENLRITADTLAGIDDFVITVGGGCDVDIAPIAAAHDRYGSDLTVLWIDAHPDVHGPGDLRSGAFHAMVVRALLGDGPTALTPARPLSPRQILLAGTRTAAACERAYIRKTGLRAYGVDRIEAAFEAVRGPVYVHVDLDVLEPTEFGSVCYREPTGVPAERLIQLIRQQPGEIVGAAITEHAPADHHPVEAAEAEIIRDLGTALHKPERPFVQRTAHLGVRLDVTNGAEALEVLDELDQRE